MSSSKRFLRDILLFGGFMLFAYIMSFFSESEFTLPIVIFVGLVYLWLNRYLLGKDLSRLATLSPEEAKKDTIGFYKNFGPEVIFAILAFIFLSAGDFLFGGIFLAVMILGLLNYKKRLRKAENYDYASPQAVAVKKAGMVLIVGFLILYALYEMSSFVQTNWLPLMIVMVSVSIASFFYYKDKK